MIMARSSGDSPRRKPDTNHPWRGTATNGPPTAARRKIAGMAVTAEELRVLRSRAGSKSISELLREHLPAELFEPLDQPDAKSDD